MECTTTIVPIVITTDIEVTTIVSERTVPNTNSHHEHACASSIIANVLLLMCSCDTHTHVHTHTIKHHGVTHYHNTKVIIYY